MWKWAWLALLLTLESRAFSSVVAPADILGAIRTAVGAVQPFASVHCLQLP